VTATGPELLWNPAMHARPDISTLGRVEMRTVLDIDTVGRVTAVTFESIEPSTVVDPVLRAHFERSLRQSRWSPATDSDGQPTAASTRLILRYDFDATGGETAVVAPWTAAETPTQTRARQQARDFEARQEILAEQLRQALIGLDLTTLRAAETPRLRLRSDVPDEQAARLLAHNIEATLGTLDGLFGPRIPLQPADLKLEAVVYQSKAKLTDLCFQQRGPLATADGLYLAPGLLALHTEMADVDSLMSVLLHEATHAWFERFVVRPGVVVPEWLSEGFAEYIGNSQIRKNQLVPGKVVKARVTLTMGGPWRIRSGSVVTVEELRKLERRGAGLKVADLVGADRDVFYGPTADQFYTSAWVLVHYLRHGRSDWEQRFADLLLAVGEGYDAGSAIRAIYGLEPAALQAGYSEHLARF
jgi:hypothetical protein